jgi:hypothetical protein
MGMSPLLNQNWANIGAKHLQITDFPQQKTMVSVTIPHAF